MLSSFGLAYLLTVSVELPVLWVGLHGRYEGRDKVFNAFWLSAVTLPVVWFVLPPLFPLSRTWYLVVAESFAPIAETTLFWWGRSLSGVDPRPTAVRDAAAILAANLLSFLVGLIFF